MRSHFIDLNYINVQKIQELVEYMYFKTLEGIKKKYLELGYRDLKDAYKQLKSVKFMDFFVDWIMHVMSKITLKTSKTHTTNCIVRATFDLVFRYAIDLDVQAFRLEQRNEQGSKCSETCSEFMELQIDIFKDNHWKLGHPDPDT